MTNLEVVKKLIGPIKPVGETNTDDERFENLKEMCELVYGLIMEIGSVSYLRKNAHEYSVKRAAKYAYEFLVKTFGTSE